MIKKLNRLKPAKTLAQIGDTEYVVLSNGSVARMLKPYVVNEKPYFNLVIDGVLRRVSGRKLLEASKIA